MSSVLSVVVCLVSFVTPALVTLQAHSIDTPVVASVVAADIGGYFGTWSLGGFLIAIVMIAAAVAIMFIALNYFGIKIPSWVIQIFWICVVAVVAIAAIRFVLSL